MTLKRRACEHFDSQNQIPARVVSMGINIASNDCSGDALHNDDGAFNPEKNKQFYLVQAEQCERAAAKAKDPKVREDWLKLAEGYRRLTLT